MKRLPRLLVATAALAAVATAAAPGWGPYVVKSGDTLWDLARAHHTTVQALQSANHLDGDLIRIGQTINVPGNGVPAAAQAPAQPPATTYVVRSGDTLTSVAQAHGSTVAALAAANHLSGRLVIYIGQRLKIPVASTAGVFAAKPLNASYAPAITASARRLAQVASPSHATVQAMVAAEAQRQGVDPALALAVAYQESGFNQRMVSATDAVGVMQLMPGTATWLADYTGRSLDRYSVADNVRGGVTLLRVLRAQASVADSIAGYYQGLASVRSRGLYADTKAYVASVQALMKQFA